MKLRYRHWGPKKVVAWLEGHYPGKQWPAVSTAGDILKREGLVRIPRGKKRKTPPYTQPFSEGNRPNALWRADFKGQFRTGDGKLCYPLTISDNYSRYRLSCRGLSRPTFEESRPWFEKAFKEYGLPEAMMTDNGAPFASEYNSERPHEAWGMKTPASLYQPSLRAYPAKVPEIAYHGDFIVGRVRHNGEIRWNGEFIYLSEALVRRASGPQAKSRTSLGNQIQLLFPGCS